MRTPNLWALFLAAACSGLAGAQESGVRLPDIGSSAASIASPEEMREYGASMLRELRSYNLVFDDPLVSDYIGSLGYRLVSFSDGASQPFTFFVVRSNEINAFAAPGGYLGFNIGLINSVQSEDELAAVIGHEIAHITQQHTLRAFEDSKKVSLPIALAMLGALVAASGRSDDAGQAAIMGGVSLMQQRAINFTRYDEIEADRIGIQTLARAGYDPLAMADTFGMFQRIMRTNGIDVPEFLRTHPVDVNRIADAKARAEALTRAQTHAFGKPALPAAPEQADEACAGVARIGETELGAARTTTCQPAPLRLSVPTQATTLAPRSKVTEPGAPNYFELMRERARTLNADSANAILRYYADDLRDKPGFDTPANRYGHALALLRVRQSQAAVEAFGALVAAHPGQSVFELGLAAAEDQAGRKADALSRYARINENYPGNRAIALAYADALLADADAKSAQRAQDLLRPMVARHADDPDLQRAYGRSAELSGDKVRAAEAFAEATFLNGRAEDALNQLKALSKDGNLDYTQRARVDARITSMTPIVLDLRKRGMREESSGSSGGLAEKAACERRLCVGVSSGRNNPPLQ
ncbi:MAG: M48 family metallopeptidase [Xanthomonadales bacterium]|nr:M48 family metallopeptidase [Xanthomonadales bacterium]